MQLFPLYFSFYLFLLNKTKCKCSTVCVSDEVNDFSVVSPFSLS